MRYLLDTNTMSALMRGQQAVAARIGRTPREDVAISHLTVAEVEFRLRLLPVSKRRKELERQWATIGPELIRMPWDDQVSRIFGERRARLERAGQRMSDFDLAIAAHALAYGSVLVSSDAAFDHLRIRRENWLR